MSKYLKIICVSLILLGISTKVAVVCLNGPSPHYTEKISIDEINYLELASNLVDFKCYGAWSEGFYTQSTRSPGYPAFLASIYLFSGKSPAWLPQIMNLLLESLNIMLIYLIGRNIYGRNTGLAAAVLYATLGGTFIYVKFVTSEIFALSLLLTSCFFLSCLKSHYRQSIAGLVITYAILIHTKPAFLIVLPFIALCIYFSISAEKRKIRLWKSAIPIMAIMLLCIPWTIRNHMIHKTLVPVSTFSGWHLLVDAESADSLSLKKLTDHAYDPKRKGYTEGEYFSESKEFFMKSLIGNPARLVFSGICRFSYYWMPQQPYFRIFQPKAYIMPVYLGDRLLIPFPDFEGIMYLSLMILAFSVYRLKVQFIPAVKTWAMKSSPLLLLLFFYTFVHIISMPLEQYRFLIEPIFIILLCGFTFDIFFHSKTKQPYMPVDIFYIMLFPAFLCLMLAALFLNKPEKAIFEYSEIRPSQNTFSFADVRELQWKNLGDIPENTVCETSGEVKYMAEGLLFESKTSGTAQKDNSAIGKLYVMLHEPRNPMGIGDMKMNFPEGRFPENGDVIKVRGTVSAGEYKDIIMHVRTWHKLN